MPILGQISDVQSLKNLSIFLVVPGFWLYKIQTLGLISLIHHSIGFNPFPLSSRDSESQVIFEGPGKYPTSRMYLWQTTSMIVIVKSYN